MTGQSPRATPPLPGPDPKPRRRLSGRRSAGYLVTGTVVSQAAQFAASPLLTRLIPPAEFGHYASALGIASLLAVVVVLAYPTAVPLAETDEESRVLTWVALCLAVTFSLLAFLVLAGLAWSNGSLLGTSIAWWYALFVPLAGVAIAAFSTLQLRLSRLGGFPQIGRATATGAIVQVVAQLALAAIGFGAEGLALGYFLGRAANVALLLVGSRIGRPPRVHDLFDAARRWSGRTRWLVLTALMNMLGTTAVTPWVAHLYGPAVAGSFALALQTLSVPAALLGQAVGTILFPRLAAAKREGLLSFEQVSGYVTGLASLAFPAFLPVLILGPSLYPIVFGADWATAGSIASVLAPWVALSFVTSPISSLVLVQGKYRHTAAIATVDTSIRLGALALGASLGSVMGGFALYAAVALVSTGAYLAWMMWLVGGNLGSVIKAGWKGCCAAAVTTLLLLALRPFVPVGLLAVLTVTASGLALALAAPRLRGAR